VSASAPTASVSAWDNTTANISIGNSAAIIGLGESATNSIVIGTAVPSITIGTGGTTAIDIGSGGSTNLSISAVTDFNTFESVNFVTEDIDRVAGANPVSLWSDAGTGVVTIGSTGALTNTSIPAATVAFTGVQTGLNAQSIALPDDTDPATLWTDSDGSITIGSNTSTVSIPGTLSPGSISSQDITRPNTGLDSVLWAGNGPIKLGDTGTTNLVIPNTFTAHNDATVTGWGNVTASANLFGSSTGNITLGSATTASVRMQNINRVGPGSNSALWPTGTGDVSVGSSSAALNLNGNVVSANAPVINLGDETTITSAQILERPDNTILGTIWDTGAGNISIGAAAGTIAIGSSGGITTVGNASSGELRSQVINAFNPASESVLFSTNNTTDIRIGEGLGTGKIELGRANVTFGGVAIQKQIAHDASSTVSLYDDVTAASTAFGGLTGNNLTIGGALGTGAIRLGTAAGTGGTLVQKISAIDPNTASSLFTNAISAVTLGPTGGATTVNIPANTVEFSGSQTGINAQNIALPTDTSAANLWTDALDVVNIATGTTQAISIGAAGGTVNLAGNTGKAVVQNIERPNDAGASTLWTDSASDISIGAGAGTVNISGNTGKAVVQNIERPDDGATSSLWTDGTSAITIGSAGGSVSLPGTVTLGSFSSQDLTRPNPGNASILWAGGGDITIGTGGILTIPNTLRVNGGGAFTGWADATGAAAIFGNASLASLAIANGTNGNISMGTGQTTGTLQLGSILSNTVRIQQIGVIGTVNNASLWDNMTAGTLSIGNSLNNSGTLVIGNSSNLATVNIAASTTSGNISIGTSLTTGTLTLGNNNFTTGSVRIQKITSINTGNNGDLWRDGTQSIFIGTGVGTNSVSIGATATTVNLAGNTGKVVVQNIERPDDLVASSLWTDGNAAITIGSAGGTVSLP
jgi:hypothetical protein